MAEDWARMFEPEGTGGYSGYGGEEERRQATKINEDAVETNKQAALDAKIASEDQLRKKRNAMFQTEGGSAGSGVLSDGIGARDTYFGN